MLLDAFWECSGLGQVYVFYILLSLSILLTKCLKLVVHCAVCVVVMVLQTARVYGVTVSGCLSTKSDALSDCVCPGQTFSLKWRGFYCVPTVLIL